MDISAIGNLIGSVGFPVVMCILMFNRMDKQDDLHKQEMDKVTESLNNNTVALTQLTAKFENKE